MPEDSYGTLTVHANGSGVFSRNILSKGAAYSLAFNGAPTSGLGSFDADILGNYIAKKIRIMPLGDSITEGQENRTPYRYWLDKWFRIYFDFDFVGSRYGVIRGEPPYSDFDQDHEGHSGWKSGQIADYIPGWAEDYNPDIVLLHIGTNDVIEERSTADIIDNIERIIDTLREQNPLVMIIVAQIISNERSPISEIVELNDAIAELAEEKNSVTSPILVADQFTGYDGHLDNFDGLHPDTGGSKKMAGVWLNKLLELLLVN